jgi:hypothetical protein
VGLRLQLRLVKAITEETENLLLLHLGLAAAAAALVLLVAVGFLETMLQQEV